MTTYLLPTDGLDFDDVIFAFDCDLSEAWDLAFKWPQYAIESGQEVSDYGVEEPFSGEISGIVTAWSAATDDEVYTRVQDTLDKLEAYARTRQPVTVVSGLRTTDMVIEKISYKRDQGTGEAAEVSIKVRSYQVATYEEVEIPAELLAPAVKAGATTDPGGTESGAGTESEEGEAFDPGAQTGLVAIGNGENPADVGRAVFDTLGGS